MDIWTQLAKFAIFETERLYLRPFSFADRSAFYQISSDSANLPFIFPRQASQAESDHLLTHYLMKEPLGVWAIEDKSSQRMIGAIRLENLNLSLKEAELGYFLHKDFWGQGLATEAVENIAFLAFQELRLSALSIIVHKENKASSRVAQKAGFRLVRQFKGSDRYSHKIRDYLAYQRKAGDSL